MPRAAAGPAVDPIALEPVDAIEITTLVDNVFDGLLTGTVAGQLLGGVGRLT
jgi:7,8-dihydropterin-6-yl-methyl-4-(beta-D-ribofuranosyl)aminobenzene 5'-phosphate synthase